MKWCLHKGLAWCVVHREWHADRFMNVTTFSDRNVKYMCVTCGGSKYEPKYESCRFW